jgi:hypothetical protein
VRLEGGPDDRSFCSILSYRKEEGLGASGGSGGDTSYGRMMGGNIQKGVLPANGIFRSSWFLRSK